MYLVTHCDHGTSVSDKIVQKTKNVVNTRFFLRFFPPAHFDHWKLKYPACVPGDHGTSVSDEIDQKTKVCQNTSFSVAIAT